MLCVYDLVFSAPPFHFSQSPILAGVPEIPAADMVEVSLRYGNTFVLVDMLPPDLFALLRPHALGAKLVVPFTALIVVDAGPFAVYGTYLGGYVTVGLAGNAVATTGRNIAVLSMAAEPNRPATPNRKAVAPNIKFTSFKNQ